MGGRGATSEQNNRMRVGKAISLRASFKTNKSAGSKGPFRRGTIEMNYKREKPVVAQQEEGRGAGGDGARTNRRNVSDNNEQQLCSHDE